MICTMTNADRAHRSGTGGRVVVAPDSFKGTYSAAEVAAALAAPLQEAGYEGDRLPLADGGEGTADALLAAAGGRRIEVEAHDPLGRPVRSWYAMLSGGETAVVEAAAASGLGLVDEPERDPERAATRGAAAPWARGPSAAGAVRRRAARGS